MRHLKGLTQEQLAEKAKISPKYLSEMERGLRNITIMNLQRIIDGLEIAGADVLDILVRASIADEDAQLIERVVQLIQSGNSKAKIQACTIIEALMK